MTRPSRRAVERSVDELEADRAIDVEPPGRWAVEWGVPSTLWDDPADAWRHAITDAGDGSAGGVDE